MCAQPVADRPNILFLFTDDQRFDTIRALGNDAIHTPTMDRLVKSGTSFTQACIMGGSSGAVCMPSRAMLMTGRTLFHIDGMGQTIDPDHVMLGERLQEAGYTCFGTGKWHNGPQAYARSFDRGAEIFFGGMEDHWNVPACNFDPTGEYAQRCLHVSDFATQVAAERTCDHIHAGKHSSELFCDATIDFLNSYDGDAPFFAYVSFMAPHDPRTMPQEYLDMYPPQEIDLPPNYLPQHPFENGCLDSRDEGLETWPRTEEAVRRHIAAYYAMITHLDAQIKRVLDTLEACGMAENTIIVLAGDNGLAVGQHGLMGKQSVYEHSVRVPLIFSGPGVPSGNQSEAFAYLIDIYPTLCEMCGVPIPDTVEGKSLHPCFENPESDIREYQMLAHTAFHRGVRGKRYKLIENMVGENRTTQLFDLRNDPWEMQNLAADWAMQGELDRLRGELQKWRTDLGDCDTEFGQSFWPGYDRLA